MPIDLHAHVSVDVCAQLARAHSAGVDQTVLLSTRVHPEASATLDDLRAELARLTSVTGGSHSPPEDHETAWTELRNAVEAHPRTTFGLVNVPLDLTTTHTEQWVAERLGHPGIVGIGELTPPPGRADLVAPVLALSDDHGGAPVLVHGFAPNTADDLATYAALAARHPRVPVLVGAFGGLHWRSLVELARQRPNLYLDLSSALQVFGVRAAARALPEQCLFGSNTPYGDVVAARATLDAAIDDAAILRNVEDENLQRIMSWKAHR
jgi:predicted TIM-barrel fold metal-dependent hydrolase